MLKVKPAGRALGPQPRGLLGGRRVVGGVHLDQRELPGVVGQPLLRGVRRLRVPARVEQRPVGPGRRAHLDRHPWVEVPIAVRGPTGNRLAYAQAARRSRFCLQVTQVVADGKISSRSTGIGAEQPSQ